jgi:hypothetical protein
VQLGHASTAITERHYAKWMPSSNAAMLEIRNQQTPPKKVEEKNEDFDEETKGLPVPT